MMYMKNNKTQQSHQLLRCLNSLNKAKWNWNKKYRLNKDNKNYNNKTFIGSIFMYTKIMKNELEQINDIFFHFYKLKYFEPSLK